MRNDTSRRYPWFGIVLIVFGSVLLLKKFDVVDIRFSQVLWPMMMLAGLVSVTRGFTRAKRGKVFGGTMMFMYGLFFFLRTFDSVDLPWYLFFPASLVITSIAFFMMYLQNIRDWYLLVLSLFIGGVGVAFAMTEYGYLYGWDVVDFIHLYWPIVLIVIGLGIIFRRRADNNQPVQVSG